MTIDRGEGSATEALPSGGVTDSPLLWAGRVTGSGLLVWMGWIHLHLWSEGYKHLGTIGPLLIANFVAAIATALLLLGVHRWNLVASVALAGAGLALLTLGALALSVNVGLFGFTESWKAPFTHVSVGIESAATAVLLATATGAAVSGRRAGTASGRRAGTASGRRAGTASGRRAGTASGRQAGTAASGQQEVPTGPRRD